MKTFFKEIFNINLFVALLCAYSTYDSATKEQWGWVGPCAVITLLNLNIALPPRYRLSRIFQ